MVRVQCLRYICIKGDSKHCHIAESSLSPTPYQDFSVGIGTENQQLTPASKDTPSLPRLRASDKHDLIWLIILVLPMQEQSRSATITETARRSNGENLFILSIVLTILCILCGGWYTRLLYHTSNCDGKRSKLLISNTIDCMQQIC